MLAVIRRNVERADLARRREESRRTLEELNRKLLDEMANKNRLASLGQASAELVHDLRNPMMIILGYVQLLAQELNPPAPSASLTAPGKPPQEADAYMGVIEQNVRRCKELIESWLDLSRTNRMTLKPVVLNDLITETVEGCRPLAAEKRATLRHEVPARAMAVLGHGVQLKRAMQNLVVNAIDALGPEGGQVTVTCAARGGEVEITVSDNGSGIDEQHLPHILKPFYTSKGEGKGSGLGLFITQKIIEDHRGVMAVDSTSGRGTRVSFRLPWLDEGQLTP
jgi:signal transduction histidine kinase